MCILIDLCIFFLTFLAYLSCFRDEKGWNITQGKSALRYFTILSNLFCALASLVFALALFRDSVPRWIWLWKFIGTAAVTVTLLTVLFFLGPSAGYKELLSGRDLYLHLIGPLLAIVSFCFLERYYPLSFSLSLFGLIPVVLYGIFYLYKVVLCPAENRWDDFYGYNKNGKWPVSFAAMMVGGFLVCAILYGLSRL